MKKLLFTALALSVTAAVNTSNAQLADGSIAPNFTVTAYQPGLASAGFNSNGTYTLYDYLDAGYTVIMDVSATWCGPCWSYHTGGAFEDFYAAHGPAGFPGVSAGTTDDAMVIWIEGDGATADATMLDGAGTIGNWINPTGSYEIEFPMANPASSAATTINNNFSIAYYPTIYKICPNRVVSEVGQLSPTALYSAVGTCPPPASLSNDPTILSYQGDNKACGAIDLVVRLQNNGTSALTSCTITATEGANVIATYPWTGNLATYGIADVTIGQFTPTSASHNISIAITSTDDNVANNAVAEVMGLAGIGADNNVTVKVSLDRYGSETSWKIFKGNGAVAYSSPTYADAAANGTYPQADINTWLPDDCYSLEVYDSYGDGYDSGYGNGLVEVWVNGALLGGVSDFPSGSEKADAFQLEAVAGIEDLLTNSFAVYPNPATDVVNVSFEASNSDYVVSVLDLQGRIVSSQVLTALSGSQTVTIPVSEIAKGSYVVTISTSGITKSQNVVIK